MGFVKENGGLVVGYGCLFSPEASRAQKISHDLKFS